MTAEELDALSVHARQHDEVVVFTPPNGWELMPSASDGIEPLPYFLDDGDDLLDLG